MSLSKLERVYKVHHALQLIYRAASSNALGYEAAVVSRLLSERRVAIPVAIFLRDLNRSYGIGKSPRNLLVHARRRLRLEVAPQVVRAELSAILQFRARDVSIEPVFDQLAIQAQYAGQSALGVLGIMRKIESVPFSWDNPPATFAELFPVLSATTRMRLAAAAASQADFISRVVVTAADPSNPLSIAETSRRMREAMPGMTSANAMRIARTETARVYGTVTQETYKRNGVPARRWLTSGSDKVDPVCRDNQAQGWVPINDGFQSGDDSPPAHPNCACDIAADVRRWLPPADFAGDPMAGMHWAETQFSSRTGDLFSPAEISQLNTYKGGGYSEVNKALRAGVSLDPKLRSTVTAIDSAMQKQVLNQDLFVYRSASRLNFPDLKAGDVLTDKAFVSTSLEETLGGTLQFRIKLPQGTNSIWMEEIGVGGEFELLLPRGSRFRVLRRAARPGGESIEMELIGG